jgi:hypothetical protein
MSAVESLRVVAQSLFQELLDCGTVCLKLNPMGQTGTWEAFISRQTTLDEFYPEAFPGTMSKIQKGEPEITIYVNSILIKSPQEMMIVMGEICEYIRDINGQEMCKWDS